MGLTKVTEQARARWRARRAAAPRDRSPDAPLRVLQSFPEPRPTTNPYIVMLRRCLDEVEELDQLTFSWRRALLGDYDVFHAHWPEILVSGRTLLRRTARQALFALLLLRLRWRRVPLVRTVHNLELPTGISRPEVLLLRTADRMTAMRIALNPLTPLDPRQASRTILHGHYRGWYAGHPRSQPVRGRLVYVGLIRRYKGVVELIDAFRQTRDAPEAPTLHVSGAPSSTDLVDEVTAAAREDPRVDVRLAFLTDAELVGEVTGGELVVLPYRDMHNSGGVLAALSLDRPVLVPDNTVNRLLGDEVGTGWVHRYDDTLDGAALLAALDGLRQRPVVGRPDLSAREWSQVGAAHLDAYRAARSALGRRRRPPAS